MTIVDDTSYTTQDSLHARLVAGIRDSILRGDLEDGVRIPEAQLCARFDVSRTPLREALKALATEGLVTLRPNRGAIVTPMDAGLLSEVFEAKAALERFIGQHAAIRADEAALSDLEMLHSRLQQTAALGQSELYSDINAAFHDRLAAATMNSQIKQIYATLQVQVRRARRVINHNPARISASLAEHEGIMDALRIRAPLDLAERLAAHNDATAQAFVAQFRSANA